MEELVSELRLFLELLDREYLSAGVREKKLHISNILRRVLAAKGQSCPSLLSDPVTPSSAAVCVLLVKRLIMLHNTVQMQRVRL